MAGRQLYVYTAYKEMQIFHFNVPPLTSNVTFKFTANDTLACNPRNITMWVPSLDQFICLIVLI